MTITSLTFFCTAAWKGYEITSQMILSQSCKVRYENWLYETANIIIISVYDA